MENIKITSALISVFDKSNLKPLIKELVHNDVTLYSTGGTKDFIQDLGYEVLAVEDLTGYPSILGGRVKTLHPKIFGGILKRSNNANDSIEMKKFQIPSFDLVVVDLYPFEKTVAENASETDIIEKIDIGGIALIRAAAKNFNNVFCISDKDDYANFISLYKKSNGAPSLKERKEYSIKAFHISSNYDTAIFNHFNKDQNRLKLSISNAKALRYGENPHQKGYFYGSFSDLLDQINGKEISYNNLLDIDSAINLMLEFYQGNPAFGIFKHNNACGFAVRDKLNEAYLASLDGDPISAFGGVLISNKIIDLITAIEINKLFFEVIIAPGYDSKAIELLKVKKNRIILVQKENTQSNQVLRSCLNGILVQDKDLKTDKKNDLKYVTKKSPLPNETEDLLFASKICKHTKSNTIVLAKNKQLIGSGTGQTSRVDALNQAIKKAKNFGFDLKNAVMASDAFFPFPDCVEIANSEGINSVIQPGGSIKDNLSVDYCDANEMSMVLTGIRHFKH